MYRILVFLGLWFHLINSHCQTPDSVIQIHIIDTTLAVRVNEQKIAFQFECKNMSDSTLLLYGLNGQPRRLPIKIEKLVDYLNRMSAGNTIYIYDASMKQMLSRAPMISKDIDYKPISREKLDSIFSKSKSEYLKATQVVKGSETVRLKKEIDLREYALSKGTYYIQLAYFSGPHTTSMVDTEQIARDIEHHRASIYYGVSISNRILLKIN